MPVKYPRRIVALAIALGGSSSSPTAFAPPLALVPRPPPPSYRISRPRGTGATPPSWSSTRFDVNSAASCEDPPPARWATARRVLASRANQHDGVDIAHDACGRNRDGAVEVDVDGECATKMEVDTTTSSSSAENRGRWRRRSWSSCLSSVAGRFDTLTSSGLSTPSDSRSPGPGALVAGTGSKRMMIIFFSFLLLKWARSKFLLKNSALNEFQPNWGHVITSKEQEKNLHAWTCKECGATMFVAKGREFRFHNRFTKCFNCGAKGKDNFYDRRDEIEDDGDFQYESPVNYRMSKKEREKLEREMEEARQKEAEEAVDAEVEEEEEEVVAVKEDDGDGEAIEVLDAEEVEMKEKEDSAEKSIDEAGEADDATAAAAVTDEVSEDGEAGAVVAAESEKIEVALEEDAAEGGATKSAGEENLTASAEVEGAAPKEAATEGADEVADVDESRTFIVGASGHTEAEVEGSGAGVVENDAARNASSSSVSSSSSSSDDTPAAPASTPSPVPEVPATKSSVESTPTTTTGKTVPSSSLKQSPVAAKEEVGGEDSLDALGMDGF